MAGKHEDVLQIVWREAFDELSKVVSAMGMQMVTAEDVLQDVYLRALRSAPPALEPDELRRWLFRVAVNRCNLEHRRQTRLYRAFGRIAGWRVFGASPSGDEQVERDEERRLIRAALHRLQPVMRTVIVMRYFADMDSKEIGQILGHPSSTVRSHLRRARNELANELEKLGYKHE